MRSILFYFNYCCFFDIVVATDANQTAWIDDITNISRDQYCSILNGNLRYTGLSITTIEYLGRFIWHTLTSHKTFRLILKNSNLEAYFKKNNQRILGKYLHGIIRLFGIKNNSFIDYFPVPGQEFNFIHDLIFETSSILSSINLCFKNHISESPSRIDAIKKIINKKLCFLWGGKGILPSVQYLECKRYKNYYVECHKIESYEVEEFYEKRQEIFKPEDCIDSNFDFDILTSTTPNNPTFKNTTASYFPEIINTTSSAKLYITSEIPIISTNTSTKLNNITKSANNRDNVNSSDVDSKTDENAYSKIYELISESRYGIFGLIIIIMLVIGAIVFFCCRKIKNSDKEYKKVNSKDPGTSV
ncbi:putative SP-containing membrane protein [Vairimorpha necatrix]|uniref:SP-containing membrane protein n=1 Tax=Vairimorpha necatrix TaxID=6039 RepID=A0AAX4JCW6_9MICR